MSKEHSILFVDDDEAIADFGRELFSCLGYNATVLTSSPEALDLFLNNPHTFDLVITDYDMPHLKGDGLAFHLKQIRVDIPIILSTADPTIAFKDVQSSGVDELLAKPYSPEKINHLIQKYLSPVD